MNTKRVSLLLTAALLWAGFWPHTASAVRLTVATTPGGLTVTVDGTNHATPVTFDWRPGDSHWLDTPSPQARADGQARWAFASWSDGGDQRHELIMPPIDATVTALFATQYLLQVTLTPTNAGAVATDPAGPWYEAGQTVTLTASTNAGYRFSLWEGVDAQTNLTAQVTLQEGRSVRATFLPTNFPYYTVVNRGGVAPGVLVGSIGGRTADRTSLYYVVLEPTGLSPLFSSTSQTLSRFLTPQGFDVVSASAGFGLKDETMAVVRSVSTVGYTLDTHDVKLWPNGHTLLFGTETRSINMSQLVANGRAVATVTGDVLQELDADNHVVFEWHTFEHIPITDSFYDLSQATIDYAHVNALTLDPTDNHLLVSLRTTSEIVKINRRTGQVMWRLGGKANMFTFLGEHPENAPYYTVGQHDVHRLANGNLLFFDNGNISGGGVTPNDRTYSRAVEYQLDEVNLTATLVWEFRHTPDISASCTGSLKRFANGNTLIDWGCAVPTSGTIVTEVSPSGEVVFEMAHRQTGGIGSAALGGGLTKQVWNSPDLVRGTNYQGIVAGEVYAAAAAGAWLAVQQVTGSPENTLVVERHGEAVRFPRFPGSAPQVLMGHVVLAVSNLESFAAELELEPPDTSYVFDTPLLHDPTELTVYQRTTPGQGEFVALPTRYDPASRRLKVTLAEPGEFVFGYPDLVQTPYPPTLVSPADQGTANQAQGVLLDWTPHGVVGSYHLQVATEATFAALVLDTNGLTDSRYTLSGLASNATYYWRVSVSNDGGTSDWATAAFTAVPPVLELTYPAGGEVWQRFQVVTIRWVGNLTENVALDIYKGGVSNRTFVASTPDSGAYTWTVGQYQAFPPGADYTIKIRSTTNPTLYDFSPPFSIITNLSRITLAANSVTNLPGGGFQFGFAVPGALEGAVLASTNLVDWEELRTVSLTNGSVRFTDETATNFPSRFYRLRVP